MRDMMDKQEYFKNLQDYIDNFDPETKVSDEIYEQRLNVCRSCDLLLEGMCRSCGCYVELRAALIKNYCPNKKW